MKKQCSKCKEIKTFSEFNRRSDRPSVYRSECKKCQYKIQHKNRPKSIVKVLNKARCAVRYALKTGKLTKPEVCTICDKSQKLFAHHPNYSQELKVIWLCGKCHRELHYFNCLLCA